jgi:aminoglycoside phosphotransferase
MFTENPQEAGLSGDELVKARTERGIFPDAQQRLEATFEKAGLSQNLELDNNVTYPTLDRWVEHRISNKRGTKFYPTFARNSAGELMFCKAQLSDNPTALHGLEYEAKRLNNIPAGVNTPRFIDYFAPTEDESAMLIVEAVPWSAGSVARAEDWNSTHAENAAQQIKILEESDLNTPETQEQTDYAEKATTLLLGAGNTIDAQLKEKIEKLLQRSKTEITPATVHGDACLKNIVIGKDNLSPVMFVDWELGERGFLGQDAAKLWSDLGKNPEVANAFLVSYLHNTDGTINETRRAALSFGVVVENLVHLKWRNEQIIQKGRRSEFPNLDNEISNLNQRIRDIFEASEKFQ